MKNDNRTAHNVLKLLGLFCAQLIVYSVAQKIVRKGDAEKNTRKRLRQERDFFLRIVPKAVRCVLKRIPSVIPA